MPPSPLVKKRYPILRGIVNPDSQTTELRDDVLPECRALRLVSDDTKRFLLVSFTKNAREQAIKSWLAQHIKSGVTLNDQTYAFFGFTESQVKGGNLLFFREDAKYTVSALTAQFGSPGLDQVFLAHGYGKYAARLGLSFSSTTEAFEVPQALRCQIPDIVAGDGTLLTDGVGMILDSFAKQICIKLNLPSDTSVFQIRLGGIKGLLARYPDAFFQQKCQNSSKKIAYRPSMLKYEGGPSMLEIQDISKMPRSARLNKSFFYLLRTLGVKQEVFETLLHEYLEELEEIFHDRQKAIRLVRGELDSEGESFDQELYEMLLAGFDTSEPHLKILLESFRKRSLDALRNKMSIPVKNSAYLMGITDEYNVLGEGEVYISLPDRIGVETGNFMVARNPAYHPGDVRLLQAVDRPELSHLKNCIVFSSKGRYSEPDQMGNGDLDGDQYFISNHDGLTSFKPRPAQIRQPSLPKDTYRTRAQTQKQNQSGSCSNVNQDDRNRKAIESYLNLRCNFLLGSVSNTWSASVGTTPKLADSDFCQALVPLIETVLDMGKTGKSTAVLGAEFDRLERSYRLRSTTPSHIWQDPLEQLRSLIPASPSNSQTGFLIDPDLDLEYKIDPLAWLNLTKEAERSMKEYNSQLARTIQADIQLKNDDYFASTSSRFREDNETYSQSWRREFVEKHFPATRDPFEIANLATKASAWMKVGYHNRKSSFAWLGARYLNWLKTLSFKNPPLVVGAVKRPLDPEFCLRDNGGSHTPRHASRRIETTTPTPHRGQRPQSYAHNSLLTPISSYKLHPTCRPPIRSDEADDGPMDIHDAPTQMPTQRATYHVPQQSGVLAGSKDINGPQPSSRIASQTTSQVLSAASSSTLIEEFTHCHPKPSIPVSHLVSDETMASPAIIHPPKPLRPVATRPEACPERDDGDHEYSTRGSNGFVRRYTCKICGVCVLEKKNGARWMPHRVIKTR